MAAARESVADRGGGDDGDVHGGARHFDRVGGAAVYLGKPRRDAAGSHLGVDELFGFQRDCAAGERVVFKFLRPQTLPDWVHCYFYVFVVFVRSGHKPADAGSRANFAGSRRWSVATAGTGDSPGKFSSSQTRRGNGGVWRGSCLRANYWADVWRMV